MDFETIARVRQAGRSLQDIADAFALCIPEAPYGKAVADVLAFLLQDMEAVPSIPLGPVDGPIYDDLANLRAIIDWRSLTVQAGACRRVLCSGVGDEMLLQTSAETWTNLYLLNYLLLSAIRPEKKAAVVVTMRDDGIRIIEWVAHYRALGFDGIFVYSNDNADGSEALLLSLAEAGIITYIRNEISGKVSPQRKAFEHSLKRLPELRRYAWVLYADSDEFLILPARHGHTIHSVVDGAAARYADRLPSAVCYQWKWMVSGNAFSQTPEILIERFQHSRPHVLLKSMVLLRDAMSMKPLHFPTCEPGSFFVDSALVEIPQSRSVNQSMVWQYGGLEYSGGQVNHYWHKSFTEYAVKKRRGDLVEDADYSYEFGRFFEWNGPESDANRDMCPELLLGRVYRQIVKLREVPGVREAEDRIRSLQPTLLDDLGGLAGLRSIYDKLVPA